jgi:aerobic-type carbon monoxide dehydrogenase small subunit (CoxS/CutS family)
LRYKRRREKGLRHGQCGACTIQLDAVGTLSGHGFHPLKAQLTCQITNLNLSGPRGALQTFTTIAFDNSSLRWLEIDT